MLLMMKWQKRQNEDTSIYNLKVGIHLGFSLVAPTVIALPLLDTAFDCYVSVNI